MRSGSYAIPLTTGQAESMRSLAAELRAEHLEGLADRAREVGYGRESMHLQTMPDGAVLLLVHLEYDGDDHAAVQDRLQKFPENDFTRWFNPRFVAYTQPPEGRRPRALPTIEELFSWRDDSR